MNHLVYCHTRNDTNEIFYIGKGSFTRAKTSGSRNQYWKNVVAKASGFKVEIVAKNLSEKEALNFEILLIKKLREQSVKLTNITAGGEGTAGIKISDEHKEKLRQAKLGKKQSPEHIAKASATRRGKKYSDAHCKAISESLKGKKMPVDSQAKKYKQVICIDTGKIYKSVTEAAKELNLFTTNISKACKGKLTQTGGYHWSYV
jgi:hypothetical protein